MRRNFKHILRRALTPCAVLLAMGLSMSSCSKNENDLLRWRAQNDDAFNSYANKPGFEKVTQDGATSYIYMKWLEKGKGKEHPIFTSRIYCHYKAYLLVEGRMIDGNYTQDKPSLFSLNRGSASVIPGFALALQNMVEGDETEFIIPWILAYGDSGEGSIKPYSALRYIVKLDSIVPESVL